MRARGRPCRYGAAGVPDATHTAAFRAARAARYATGAVGGGVGDVGGGDACAAAIYRIERAFASDGIAPTTWLPVAPPWEGAAHRRGAAGCGVAPPPRDYWFSSIAGCGRAPSPMSSSTARAIVTVALGVVVSVVAALFVLDFRTERREKAARAPSKRAAAAARSAKKNE